MRRAKQWTIVMLVFTVAFGMFGSTAWGASTRYAVITDVSGTVMVTKAGGSKAVRVFKGMGLNEGDSIKVNKGSGVTLKVADQEDEIVLGENWNGVISKLKQSSSGGKETAVKTWSGSMHSKVKKLTGSSDSYKVETPTAVMGVRGTHYSIVVDPVTGVVTMVVHSGQISVGQTSEESDAPDASMVLPAQQLEAYSRVINEDVSIGISYADLERLIDLADDEVIEKILLNKVDIDNENNELLGRLQSSNPNSTLDLSAEETLERYKANVDNILFHLLNDAIESNKLSDEQAQAIINQANQQISNTNRQFDLNRAVPPLDRTAGVDPTREQQRQELQQSLQDRQQERQEQKEQQREQFITRNLELLGQLQQRQQQQQEANQQAQQEKQQQARQQYVNSLNEQQRVQFVQNQQQIQQEEQSQNQRRDQPSGTTTPSGGTGGSDNGNTAPSPSLSLQMSSVTGNGFNIAVKLHNFTGTKSVYGVQLHFIHETGLTPNVTSDEDVYYNHSKFASSTTVDSLRYEMGTYEGRSINETIYALTVFGGGTEVPFNNAGEVLAAIPFHGSGSGSVKLAYVQIVDKNGNAIATWAGSQLPSASNYSLGLSPL